MHYPRSIGLGLLLVSMGGCPSKEASQLAGPPPATVVTVSQPIQREIQETAEFNGRLEAQQNVEVRARVSGFLVKTNFEDGKVVKEGDVLFEIDPRPFDADLKIKQASVEVGKADLAKVMVQYTRLEALFKDDNASIVEWETSKAEKLQAEAAIDKAQAEADQAKLDLDYTKVVAPISGRISESDLTVGNYVIGGSTTGRPLTRIVSIDPIWAYFNVDERTVLLIQKNVREGRMQAARESHQTPVHVGTAVETGYPHAGVIDFVDNMVDPSTGTIRVRGLFQNEKQVLSPGLFVRVQVQVGPPYPAMMVTERAIGTDQGQKYVFVVNNQSKVEYRRIMVGVLKEGMRVVTGGLNKDDWIIVNGLQRVRPGSEVKPERTKMPELPGATTATTATTTAPTSSPTH